jgi:DNA-binding XRE family transcriptional regulator
MPAYVLRNNRPTHVLLPVDEYEELLKLAEANELSAKLDDTATKWVDAGEAAAEIAAGWIAAARKRAGLTQKQLADKLGVPQSQVSRIEKHPDHTTVRTMQRVAAALGVDVGALMSFAGRAR